MDSPSCSIAQIPRYPISTGIDCKHQGRREATVLQGGEESPLIPVRSGAWPVLVLDVFT